MDFQPLEIDDFSGGRTDLYVNAPANKAREMDNLLIFKDPSGKAKAKTRPGCHLWFGDYKGTDVRISTLIEIDNLGTGSYAGGNLLVVQSGASVGYPDTGTTATLVGAPEGVSYSKWGRETTVATLGTRPFYLNSLGAVANSRGLPDLATSPTVTPTANTSKSYIYAFAYYHTYTDSVFGIIREVFGPVTQVSVTNADAPQTNQNNIAAIPTKANAAGENYPTASMKVKIYRTINNGSTLYYIGQVNNGTAIFADNISDATIQANNILLYTEGGVPDNDPPPFSAVVHTVNDTTYYGNIVEGSIQYTRRIRQSQIGNPDAAPGSFFVDFDDDVIAISSARSIPIVLCRDSVYRLEGAFDEVGRGEIVAVKIGDKVTCSSFQSAVQANDMVFWFGYDSVYATDGYKVFPLNTDQRDTHQSFTRTKTQSDRIQGKFDKVNNRIWWTVQTERSFTYNANDDQVNSGVTDCNACYVLDLTQPLTDTSTFTTISGDKNFSCTAIAFVKDGGFFSKTAAEVNGFNTGDNLLIRGNRHGHLLIHSKDDVVDSYIAPDQTLAKNRTENPTDTEVLIYYNTVIHTLASPSFNFGTNFIRKYVPKINLACRDQGALSLQVISNNDDGKKIEALTSVRYRGDCTWGDQDLYWGDPTATWNQGGMIIAQRHFPAKNLRCSYKQVTLTNAYVAVVNSDLLGQAVVDSVSKTVTLVNAAGTDWPKYSRGYFISFSTDSYVREYEIIYRTNANVLQYYDTNNFSTSGTVDWVLRGYPKGEVLSIMGYTMHFAYLGKTQQPFRSDSTGEVGADS